jgi:hypothetical protein
MQDSTQLQSINGFNYCPLCGAELDREEQQIAEHRWNLKVTCPEHGELISK